jgi:hypothetical protein
MCVFKEERKTAREERASSREDGIDIEIGRKRAIDQGKDQ